MHELAYLWDLVMHLDVHLGSFTAAHGLWIYALLFVIIFCETGLVITPFLPGDSLLFAVGALAANPATGLSAPVCLAVLLLAAILGDSVNYQIGKAIGPRIFSTRSRWFNPAHLQRTHNFFEKYGGKTIILARFVPIVRTFAPFVAGVGAMTYRRFLFYNVVGAILWTVLLFFAGYFFGSLDFVKRNFSFVVLAIIIVSVLPIGVDLLRHKWRRKVMSDC